MTKAKAKEPVEVVAFETTTPSGIDVRYTAKPKRKYEVRHFTPDRREPGGGFHSPWEEVPSVTTVLDVLDKKGLPWWGQGVGIEGVLALYVDNRIVYDSWSGGLFGAIDRLPATKESVTALLTEHKLTVNHQRDKAGARGTAVHDAFELWCKNGAVPDPAMFPPIERGYVEGLLAFLTDVQPEPLAAEVMVGSVEHGFAGRYDARLRIPEECQVVYKITPAKGAHYATLEPGSILCDLKTSSGTYITHHKQLAAYELASVECGYEPTTAQGIIHVLPDGGYEFVRSEGKPEDFLTTLAEVKSQDSLTARIRARRSGK